MSNPIDRRVTFTQLAGVLGQIGAQKKDETTGIYADEGKVYVKFGDQDKKTLVTVLGKAGKAEKNIQSEELVRLAETSLNTANKILMTTEQLEQFISGLDVLKDRITDHSKMMSPIKRTILSWFGVVDKTDALVRNIEKIQDVSKKLLLNKQKSALELEIPQLKENIASLTSQKKDLTTKTKEQEAKIEPKQKKVEKLTEQLEAQRERLAALQQEDSATSLQDVPSQVDQQIAAQSKIMRAAEDQKRTASSEKERARKVKGARTPSLFGKESPARTAYLKAKEQLSQAEKAVKSESSKLAQLVRDKESLGKKSTAAISHRASEQEKIAGKIGRLQEEIGKRQHVIEGLTRPLEQNRSALAQVETDLDAKTQQLAKKEAKLKEIIQQLSDLEQNAASAAFKFPRPRPPSSIPHEVLFAIPDKRGTSLATRQALIVGDIQEKLGLWGSTEKHHTYLQRLIFGFSVGQKQTIDEIASKEKFTVDDLQKMLEGGNSLENMYFVAFYLEDAIPRLRESGTPPQTIENLLKLQQDLKRSLPFALRLRSIEDSKANQSDHFGLLQQDIQKTLGEMKEGERLFLPVGTGEHETLLCLKKVAYGQIETIYYNTGDGVEENIDTGFGLRGIRDAFNAELGKAPTKKTFPPSDATSEQFENMLSAVLKNRSLGRTISDLNKGLTENLGKGTPGEPKKVQINGVCSFQVLSEAFKDVMGSREAYLPFKLDLLQHLKGSYEKLPSPSSGLESDLTQRLLDDLNSEIEHAERLIK